MAVVAATKNAQNALYHCWVEAIKARVVQNKWVSQKQSKVIFTISISNATVVRSCTVKHRRNHVQLRGAAGGVFECTVCGMRVEKFGMEQPSSAAGSTFRRRQKVKKLSASCGVRKEIDKEIHFPECSRPMILLSNSYIIVWTNKEISLI